MNMRINLMTYLQGHLQAVPTGALPWGIPSNTVDIDPSIVCVTHTVDGRWRLSSDPGSPSGDSIGEASVVPPPPQVTRGGRVVQPPEHRPGPMR